MVNLMRTSGIIHTEIKKKTWYMHPIQIYFSKHQPDHYWNSRYVCKGNLLSFEVTVCIISAASGNNASNTKVKMQSNRFVGGRCHIVPVRLHSPSSFNLLSSLKFSRAAACLVFPLPDWGEREGQGRWEWDWRKRRGLSLKRLWIGPEWIVDVLCNYTHIELFTVDLSYFELHWCVPPYWLKAASI